MSKLIDLTGQRFGRLTVIERAGNNKQGRATWLCRCDCGKEVAVIGMLLRKGLTRSCGCLQRDRASEKSLHDLTGQRFGRLTVVERADNKGESVYWLCRCDCGKETIVARKGLQTGETRSCGCLRAEMRKRENTTHGGSRTRLHRIWKGMKQRCFDPKHQAWKYYGGRGITICCEWQHDFAAFREWALSHGYRDDLSIDRIDVNGNYCPENCRWATAKEQNANQRPRRKKGAAE